MKIGIWYDLFFNHIFDTSYIGVKNNKYVKVDPKSEFIAPTTFKNSAKKATQWFENSSKKLCKNSNNSSVNPNSCPLQKYGKGGAGWADPTLILKPYVVPLPTHFNTNELPTYELGSLSMLQKKFYGLFLKSGQLL